MQSTQLHLRLRTELPCLSWCAHVKKNDPEVLVYHGASVETGDDFFCEGAWSGSFSKKGFSKADFFTGSGGFVSSSGLLISTASHTLAPVYLMRSNDEIALSNSLPFLLSQTGDDLDIGYKYYESDVVSIRHGLREYVKYIPTKSKNRIYIYVYCNIEIGDNFEIAEKPKPGLKPFEQFDDYDEFLKDQVSLIVKNAQDPLRKQQYQPIATISIGYDSPACAVLAKSSGCRDAITFTHGYNGEIDSGKTIAEILGLNINEHERDGYLKRDDFPEIEFVAACISADDVIMAPLG
jgi:hypothetical protein